MDALESIQKARDCLARVCREQRFRLHVEIPARPGLDDDLVISDGLEDDAAEIARLRARVEELEAVGGPVSQMTLDEWVRQMTLDEWVNILPAPHRAVVELAALRWKVEGLERVVKFAISQGAHSHLCAARSSGPCDCWKRTVSDDLAAIDAAREGE